MKDGKFKVGILQTGRRPDALSDKHLDYDVIFEELLCSSGFAFQAYAVLDGQFPANTHDADGWLVTGSAFGVYENHSWIPQLEDFVRKAYFEDIPIVGICFGHQLIAQALGGKVEKFDGGWALGPTNYQLENETKTLTLHAWHQDQVTELPDQARVLASNDFCKFAALAYANTALSWQPHPEFGDEYVLDLMKFREASLPKDTVKNARQTIGVKLSSNVVANQITEFFKSHQQHF